MQKKIQRSLKYRSIYDPFCEIPKFLRKCLPSRPSGIQGALVLLPGKTRIASRATHNEEITVPWTHRCIHGELVYIYIRKRDSMDCAVNYLCCPTTAYAYTSGQSTRKCSLVLCNHIRVINSRIKKVSR